MTNHDARIDTYITNAADFAQPILQHLRKLIHTTCPDVEESVKWGMPSFNYRSAPMCTMAAFKQHCSFGFWLRNEVLGDDAKSDGMGPFDKLISLQDLRSDKQLTAYIRTAMALNAAGVKQSRPKVAARPAPTVPAELAAYDWIAETSIYVHADAKRRGIARQLYSTLLAVMRLQGNNQSTRP